MDWRDFPVEMLQLCDFGICVKYNMQLKQSSMKFYAQIIVRM